MRRFRYYLPAVVVFAGTIARLGAGRSQHRPARLPAAGAERRSWPRSATTGRTGRWPLGKAAARDAVRGARRAGDRDARSGSSSPSLTARFATARELLLPLAIGASAVPIIAFAPLMNNWFGVLNPLSKMMIVAVLVFFPVVVNVTRGLTQVEPAALELMRSYAASEWTVLRVLRLPNTLPYFFTALKIGTTLSLIGAIVGEYFGGIERRARAGRRPERQRATLRRHVGGHHPGGDRRDRPVSGDRRHRASGHPVARIGAQPGAVGGAAPGGRSGSGRAGTAHGQRCWPSITEEERMTNDPQVPGTGRGGQLLFAACSGSAASAPGGSGEQPSGPPERCARGGAARLRPRPRSGCSSSGCRRPSSPATSPPSSRATTRPTGSS